jgi:DNA-binding transcriptional LysR family regulator
MSTYDPDALECLAAIIEEGGFERAAQRLSITQSAVSQRLRALEAQVGTVLIVRSRPLKPTPAGQLMLKHAKMMRLLRRLLFRAGGFRVPARGHPRTTTVVRGLVPLARAAAHVQGPVRR